jgi:hypothetical protein
LEEEIRAKAAKILIDSNVILQNDYLNKLSVFSEHDTAGGAQLRRNASKGSDPTDRPLLEGQPVNIHYAYGPEFVEALNK